MSIITGGKTKGGQSVRKNSNILELTLVGVLNKHASNPLSRYFWYQSRLHVDHSLDGSDLQQINYYLNKGQIARYLCSHLKDKANTPLLLTPIA